MKWTSIKIGTILAVILTIILLLTNEIEDWTAVVILLLAVEIKLERK